MLDMWPGGVFKDSIVLTNMSHTIWDPHFGRPAGEAFTRGGASSPVNIAYSRVYQIVDFSLVNTYGVASFNIFPVFFWDY